MADDLFDGAVATIRCNRCGATVEATAHGKAEHHAWHKEQEQPPPADSGQAGDEQP